MPLEPMYFVRDLESTTGVKVFREDKWVSTREGLVQRDELLKFGDVEMTADQINEQVVNRRIAEKTVKRGET